MVLRGVKLSIPDPGRRFIIRTDASHRAVGGVIEQLEEGQELPSPGSEEKIRTRPIAFLRKLDTGQIKSWPVREKEEYAIFSILKKTRFPFQFTTNFGANRPPQPRKLGYRGA